MPVVAEAVGFEARLLLIASSCQVDEADLSTDFRFPLVGCTPQDAAGCFSSRKISGLMLLPFICFCCVHQVMHVRRLLTASQVIQVESIYVCMPSGRTQADAIHMLQAPKGEGTDFAADVSFQLANGPLSSFLLLLVSLCCLNYMLKIQRQVCACACICTKTGVCVHACALITKLNIPSLFNVMSLPTLRFSELRKCPLGGVTTHLRKFGQSTVKLMRLYYLIK